MAYELYPDKSWNVVNTGWRVVTDQHDRKWGCAWDKSANAPKAAFEPIGWQAPFRLPQNASQNPYYRLEQDDDGELRKLVIDYDQRLGDLRQAHKDWSDQLYKIGFEHFRGFDPQHPPMELLRAVGPKPAPLEPVLACKAEDPWILGKTPAMPEWAKPYFVPKIEDEFAFMREAEQHVAEGVAPAAQPGQTYQQFVAEQRKAGYTLAEIGAMWRERSKMGDRPVAVGAG